MRRDANGFGSGYRRQSLLWRWREQRRYILSIPLAVIQDIGEAINTISPESSFFCSELVLMAFKKANAPITFKSPAVSAPSDIPGSHQVAYVGHLKSP